jgi:peptidylprolyl isomerase
MPKTTKRAATKRAEKIARAHASELIVREAPQRKRVPGYKPPARGVARYPWATILLVLLVVGLTAWIVYFYHLGPFALPPKKTTAPTVAAVSPCLKVVKQVTDSAAAPSATAIKDIQHTYKSAPAMAINTQKTYCAGINTTRGLIIVELDPKLAPHTVNNFAFLAQRHFYDGLLFHRVVPNFIIQSGDPRGTGTGGPGYKFNDEPVPASANYSAGCLAMANAGANTNGSQFFICTADDSKSLQKSYNLFGHVVQGLDVAKKIQGPGDTASSKKIKPDVINHIIVVQAP